MVVRQRRLKLIELVTIRSLTRRGGQLGVWALARRGDEQEGDNLETWMSALLRDV